MCGGGGAAFRREYDIVLRNILCKRGEEKNRKNKNYVVNDNSQLPF